MTYIGGLMDTLKVIKQILSKVNTEDKNNVETAIAECTKLIEKLNV
jgi:hypothetical protein